MRTKSRAVSVILSLFLVVVMLVGMMPVSAISVLNTYEATDIASYKPEEFKVPDIIDEEEQAEKSYVGRVKEDEKDLYTFVFKNEDGSNTMHVFDHPVKYIDDKCETRDISLEISKDKDGTFKAADHMIKASFGNDISEGIGLEYDDVRIEMVAKSGSIEKAKAGLSDDGKKLTYAVDDKTSYVYSLTYCGIKEDIVVSEYTGQTEYEFILKTNGLHPVKINDSVFLADDEEEIKASIGDIIIFTADNRNNAFGDLQFETVEENSEYKFTIVLAPDYLRDEKTAYPITIDPTIEINYDNNGAGAIEDVTINSLDTSSGSSGSLFVGLRNPYGKSRILMRFPTLNLSGIVSADNITSATVEMKDLLCETESMTVYCYIFNGNSWSESNVDWQTVSPNSYTTFLSSKTVSYSIGNSLNPLHRYSFNILNAVKGWKNGTANQSKGIIFKASGSVESGNTYINKTFASYNRATNKPSLIINYIPLYNGIIGNGVYALKNKATGKYLDIQSDSPKENKYIQQYAYETVPSTDQTRSGLFKFTHQGSNGYIIRTMRNNSNSFRKIDDLTVKTLAIDPVDGNNSTSLYWYLSSAGSELNHEYYYLRPDDSNKYLCTPVSGVNSDIYCTIESISDAGDRAKWELIEYTGSTMHGLKVKYLQPCVINMGSGTLISDDSLETDYFYSTEIGVNSRGSILDYYLTNPSGATSNIAYMVSNYLFGINNKPGMVSVSVVFQNAVSEPFNLYFKPTSGEYFFMQNIQNTIGCVKSKGTYSEKIEFDYDDKQIWQRVDAGSGYYYIKNMDGNYLTSPVSTSEYANIELESTLLAEPNCSRQKWKFEDAPSNTGAIRIKSASSGNLNLWLNINSSNNKLIQGTYVNNNSYYDEFNVVMLGNDVVYLRTFADFSDFDISNIVKNLYNYYDGFELIHLKNQLGSIDDENNPNACFNIALSMLENSRIMVLGGHSTSTLITISDYNQHHWLTTEHLNKPNVDLSLVDIVIFDGCSTAAEPSSGYNLPKTAELKGAKVAIGWIVPVIGTEQVEWINNFFEYLNKENPNTHQLYTANEAFLSVNAITDSDSSQAKIYGTQINFSFH